MKKEDGKLPACQNRDIASTTSPSATGHGGAAFLVSAGILLSRVSGLVRDSVFAHFFGTSPAADAFRAAMRIPNVLQNILGEGTLSASFIPVYAGLLARREERDAGQVAGAIASLLGLATTVLVALGVLLTPWLIPVIAPGFHGERRELCVVLVRIFFPATGLLVWSAWCLAILNSHRRFFVGYAVPVLWNAVIVATLLTFGRRSSLDRLAVLTAWGAVAGSLVQFVAQLPLVLRLAPHLRLVLSWTFEPVRRVVRNFLPVFTSRGVVQLSAYLDSMIASLLPTGSFAALTYAQTLYVLPVSLFGMSISTTELTEMSHVVGVTADAADELRARLESRLRQIAFLVVPSAAAFLAFGDVIAAGIYRSGRFTQADAIFVWKILAGSSIGLLASTMSRLLSSTYYALGDTRTPFRYAVLRVALTGALGYGCAVPLPPLLGIDPRWGAAALAGSAGVAGWIEFALLRRSLARRIGAVHVPLGFILQLWGAAAVAAGLGWLLRPATRTLPPAIAAVIVLGVFGLAYFALLAAAGNNNARALIRRALRMAGRG
ncbi:MAG: murein biosynthesis integral membrane protein MurJ [Bryobacteraceae bacterium]|jgi:putative peptidoglycan lipid II flippase